MSATAELPAYAHCAPIGTTRLSAEGATAAGSGAGVATTAHAMSVPHVTSASLGCASGSATHRRLVEHRVHGRSGDAKRSRDLVKRRPVGALGRCELLALRVEACLPANATALPPGNLEVELQQC